MRILRNSMAFRTPSANPLGTTTFHHPVVAEKGITRLKIGVTLRHGKGHSDLSIKIGPQDFETVLEEMTASNCGPAILAMLSVLGKAANNLNDSQRQALFDLLSQSDKPKAAVRSTGQRVSES